MRESAPFESGSGDLGGLDEENSQNRTVSSLTKHTSYLLHDFRGELAFVARTVIIGLSQFSWTFINRIKCILAGVTIDRKTTFIGNCIVKRHQLSEIRVGPRCIFVSSSYFNLIGVNHGCIISTHLKSARIVIGQKCGFSGTAIAAFNSITIGDNVRCGANTLITDSDWHLDDPRSGIPRAVLIGDNVWLGVNVVVLKGVTIGNNSMIGANSVVTKSIPDNVIAAGNPCVVLKAVKS
jgi:acetyltransferase-like isoleucine patch superfamily enzyme